MSQPRRDTMAAVAYLEGALILYGPAVREARLRAFFAPFIDRTADIMMPLYGGMVLIAVGALGFLISLLPGVGLLAALGAAVALLVAGWGWVAWTQWHRFEVALGPAWERLLAEVISAERALWEAEGQLAKSPGWVGGAPTDADPRRVGQILEATLAAVRQQ